MHPFNFTLDLCSILNGALCPLPMYNFTGMDSIPLPSSLGVSDRIPGIAYKIPDLEAFVQLTMVETSTGILKACVQSTLSNGQTAHQEAVEWSTGGLAILALLSAIWQSLSPDALSPYRLLDLFYLYQFIATTGLLDLNYPSVYRAFTLNFAWAMGLFSAKSGNAIQTFINHMRHLTGGTMADAGGGGAVGLVNRNLSPYNSPGGLSAVVDPQTMAVNAARLPQIYITALSNMSTTGHSFNRLISDMLNLAASEVQTVTQTSSNVLQAGVPIFVSSLGIATANAFMTIFFSVLILVAITLAALGLVYIILHVAICVTSDKERWIEMKYRFPSFSRAWGLRLVSPFYLQ